MANVEWSSVHRLGEAERHDKPGSDPGVCEILVRQHLLALVKRGRQSGCTNRTYGHVKTVNNIL